MFGYAAFAQTPFAALGSGGVAIDVSLQETGQAAASTALASSIIVAAQAEAASTSSVVNTLNNIFNPSVSEAASGASAQARQLIIVASIAENASTIAISSATRAADVYLSGVQLYVFVGGALVWGPIDDVQNPGWTILPS